MYSSIHLPTGGSKLTTNLKFLQGALNVVTAQGLWSTVCGVCAPTGVTHRVTGLL